MFKFKPKMLTFNDIPAEDAPLGDSTLQWIVVGGFILAVILVTVRIKWG